MATGIYIHIPFCKQRCSYCDFHFSTDTSYTGQMIQAICREIELRVDEIASEKIETLYFGGGTPSIISIPELKSIFQMLAKKFNLNHLKEITLEANPDDITAEKVTAWKDLGINRLSIGAQSFDDEDLEWMNRAHRSLQSRESIQIAQDHGITNLTIDLMYGLPNMSLERWKHQLITAIDLGVQHLSCYCLTVEPRTLLYRKVQKKELIPADQDLQNSEWDELINYTAEKGFIHYEISNFALPNFIAVHNSHYWTGNNYLGIGPSAHSLVGNCRSWNVRSNHIYMNELAFNKLPREVELLTPNNQFNEMVLTGLRTIWGVKLEQLQAIRPFSKSFLQKMDEFKQKGWLVEENRIITLTESAKRFADAIAGDLFEVE